MAVAATTDASRMLTYDQYLAEGEVMARYDIVDGARIFMPGPTLPHQDIQGNIYESLRNFQRRTGSGRTYQAPADVLIRRQPLRTRQPDVLFVSNERLAQRGGVPREGPLEVAPELVVEILSPSDTPRVLEDKITDYMAIGVQECWVVNTDVGTVEVLRLTAAGAQTVATCRADDTLTSITFPDLTLSVTDIFAP